MMVSEKELLAKYIQDVSSIWDQEFTTQSESYFTDSSFRENLITPRDIKQVILNFNLKNDESMVDYLRSIGCDVVYEDQEYRIIKDSFNRDDENIPVVRVNTLNVTEGMELAYHMLMKEKVEKNDRPVDIIELSYDLKNLLKFPDEFFNEFPSQPLSTPTKNSQISLANYGRVQDIRMYYNYFYINRDIVIPSSSYPARVSIDSTITIRGLIDALSSAFEDFSRTGDFASYMDYRMLKNIRNKYVAKKGKPVNLSLWSEKEINYALHTGLFTRTENTLVLAEDRNAEDLNLKIDELRISSIPVIKKWKQRKLFS